MRYIVDTMLNYVNIFLNFRYFTIELDVMRSVANRQIGITSRSGLSKYSNMPIFNYLVFCYPKK